MHIINLNLFLCLFIGFGFIANNYANELDHNRLGEIVFGEKIALTPLVFKESSRAVNGCRYVKSAEYPNLDLMIVDGVIERVDTTNVKLINQASPFYGLMKKSITLTTFKKLHPKIEVTPHEYENGFYLKWFNEDKSKGIVIDYIDGEITLIKAGLVPAVLFVEGCA